MIKAKTGAWIWLSVVAAAMALFIEWLVADLVGKGQLLDMLYGLGFIAVMLGVAWLTLQAIFKIWPE